MWNHGERPIVWPVPLARLVVFFRNLVGRCVGWRSIQQLRKEWGLDK